MKKGFAYFCPISKGPLLTLEKGAALMYLDTNANWCSSSSSKNTKNYWRNFPLHQLSHGRCEDDLWLISADYAIPYLIKCVICIAYGRIDVQCTCTCRTILANNFKSIGRMCTYAHTFSFITIFLDDTEIVLSLCHALAREGSLSWWRKHWTRPLYNTHSCCDCDYPIPLCLWGIENRYALMMMYTGNPYLLCWFTYLFVCVCLFIKKLSTMMR